jgi:phosphatidylinositol alpha-1,6-mannosyltransferase
MAQTLQQAAMNRGADVVAMHLNLAPLALVGARVAGGRCVLMLHGLEIGAARTRVRCWAARHADVAVAVSHATALESEILLRLPPEVIHVVTPGVNHRESASRREPAPDVRLLTVTRLIDGYKHVDSVIAALREPSLSSAQLAIVGDGPSRPVLQELATELGVADRISFTGAVEDTVLEKFYRDSDLFVLPSTQEGFGLVYAEAMGYGLPCIGARGCGSEDAIIDGATGRLIDEPGAEAVAAAAVWTLDPRRYASLSAQALHRARHDLSADAFGNRLVAALDGVDR